MYRSIGELLQFARLSSVSRLFVCVLCPRQVIIHRHIVEHLKGCCYHVSAQTLHLQSGDCLFHAAYLPNHSIFELAIRKSLEFFNGMEVDGWSPPLHGHSIQLCIFHDERMELQGIRLFVGRHGNFSGM